MDANQKAIGHAIRVGGGLRVGWVLVLLYLMQSSIADAQQACDGCTASAFNQITAAFATEGYWIQANLIHQLENTDLGLWAPLLYIMAVFSGLIMMAMGQPPRIYLWFLLGPAIYNWLLFTPVERTGVAWKAATHQQDQEQVWRLSEVGLLNSNEIIRRGVGVSSSHAPTEKAKVALVFAWFDDLISAQIDFLVGWSGIFNQRKNPSGDTNTHEKPKTRSPTPGGEDKAWFILTNSKWPMLNNITSAALNNADLRDAFVTFMSSECGDVIAKHVRKGNYVSAAHSKGAKLPKAVLAEDLNDNDSYKTLADELLATIIPAPASFISLTADKGEGALSKFSQNLNFDVLRTQRHLDCRFFLWALVQGFRWEAGNIYNQVISEASDSKIPADQVIYSFLYGWRFEDEDGRNLAPLSLDKQRHYVQNLILLHLLRNEQALAPNPVSTRFSSSEKTVNYTKAYIRNVGSKSKYGELYTWAKMMPFVQGVLLWILTAAYPICCILIVIPGWWKVMFTWMGFFAWAKSWDAGFAIVMSIERSIWAMIGNSMDMGRFNYRVLKMEDLGTVKISGEGCDVHNLLNCMLPIVTDAKLGGQSTLDALKTFDQGLLMAAQLDMDLANAFYVYIMSALYFAVPAITGQVLLGAKAGASGMVSTMVGGTAQEAGRSAGSGYTGDFHTRLSNTAAVVSQVGFAKGLRTGDGNYAMAALRAGNQGFMHEIDSAAASTRGSLYEFGANAAGYLGTHRKASLDYLSGAVKAGYSGTKALYPTHTAPNQVPTGEPAAVEGGPGAGGGSNISSAGGGVGVGAAVLSYGYAGGVFGATKDQLADSAHANMHRMDQALTAFKESGFGKAAALAGNRYAALAQQSAGEDQWHMMRNYSQGLMGAAAAQGVFSGALSAGAKPIHLEGMAGIGMLNRWGRGTNGNPVVVEDAQAQFYFPKDHSGLYVNQAGQELESLRDDFYKIYNPSKAPSLPDVMEYATYKSITPHAPGQGAIAPPPRIQPPRIQQK